MAFNDAKTFAADINVADHTRMRLAMRQLAGLIDNPIADAKITAAAATTSPRRITFQVRDRNDEPWKGTFIVLVVIGTAALGGPAGTQTLSVATGYLLGALTANQVLLCQTNASGVLEIDVASAAPPITRYASCGVVGRLQSSAAYTIT